MNYLLLGGEFNNKGAEAMTLVALKNIYECDPEASVYMVYNRCKQPFDLKKRVIYIHLPIWTLRKLIGKRATWRDRERIKDFIRVFVPGKESSVGKAKQTEKILKTIDIVIDISGFAFSSKWGDEGVVNWLDSLRLMEDYGAKVWLMPQSFGPFDFDGSEVVNYGKSILERCESIYTREKSGYKLLKELGLKNIVITADSVLLEKNFDASLVVKNINKYIEKIEVKNTHNICIIPNYRLIDLGGEDHNEVLQFYVDVIDKYIIDQKFDIYLVAHAGEDLVLCREIKEKYKNSNRVQFIDHVMYSFNYENFIRKMDFIIASRYHAIIHGYKEYVPAVVLGWADKYRGITSDVGQEMYLIDLGNYDEALSLVDRMALNYQIESDRIKEQVLKLQQESCYAFLKGINEDS